jgi:hypothetical protein
VYDGMRVVGGMNGGDDSENVKKFVEIKTS